MSTIEELNRTSRLFAAAGGVYSLGVVIWFFCWFAYRISSQPLEVVSRMFVFGILASAPYAALWIAQQFSRSRSASRLTLSVTSISFVTSLLAYLPALSLHQDGEFAVVFYLGLVQLAFAIGCCIYAFIARPRGQ